MSKDVILVFGSVTSKQYDRLRLVMFREHMQPKVVRIGNGAMANSLSDQFDYDEDKIVDEKHRIIDQAFGDCSLRDVRACVFPLTTEDYYDDISYSNLEFQWSWVLELLEESGQRYNTYNVELTHDGKSFWLDGGGTLDLKLYGELLYA